MRVRRLLHDPSHGANRDVAAPRQSAGEWASGPRSGETRLETAVPPARRPSEWLFSMNRPQPQRTQRSDLQKATTRNPMCPARQIPIRIRHDAPLRPASIFNEELETMRRESVWFGRTEPNQPHRSRHGTQPDPTVQSGLGLGSIVKCEDNAGRSRGDWQNREAARYDSVGDQFRFSRLFKRRTTTS